MSSLNFTALRQSDWNVTWGSVHIGLVDAVDPTGMKYILKVLKAGTTGDVPLGHRFQGIEGIIKVQALQLDKATLTGLQPWSPDIAPPPGKDLYDYAKTLILHPTYLPATDRSLDLSLRKAVPQNPYNAKRDGVKNDVWELEFFVYPDREKLAKGEAFAWGKIGPL